MDFLEGSLLGPLWSDSDYEDRNHRSMYALFGLIFWLVFGLLVYRANLTGSPGIFRLPVLWLILFLVMTALSPVFSYLYYDYPAGRRLLILGFQTVKLATGYIFIYSLLIPRLILRLDRESAGHLLERFNGLAEHFFSSSNAGSSVGSLVFSLILMLLAFVAVFAIAVLVMIYLPILVQKLFHLLQGWIDRIFLKRTVAQRRARRAQAPFPMFNQDFSNQVDPAAAAVNGGRAGARHKAAEAANGLQVSAANPPPQAPQAPPASPPPR